MTSSKRHLKHGQGRWDYNVQQYKSSRDVFFEKGLFSILFLACGRHDVTRRCLLSTIDAVTNYSKPLEWILMENGNDDQNYQFFHDLKLERKVVIRQSNYGINEAWNQMWSISRGEFCIKLENDFENRKPDFDFINIAYDIFQEKPDVAIVQLRAIWDPCENWGLYKEMYNPWSCDRSSLKKVKVYDEETKNGHKYLLGTKFYGFNNNPNIIRKTLYREYGPYPECEVGSDPRHGESFLQEIILNSGCAISHINKEIYFHVGQVTTKSI
jgi:glycosyltransferase involved in cell wall biosynthesis